MSAVEFFDACYLAVSAGAAVSYPDRLRKIIDAKTEVNLYPQVFDTGSIICELGQVMCGREITRPSLKKELGVSKADVLKHTVAFTDQHNHAIPEELFPKSVTFSFLNPT